MNLYTKTALLALTVLGSVGAVSLAYAQVGATMPVLYNQSGTAVNTNGGTLAAGNYFLMVGPSTVGHQVQYYGNGTFYDPSIQQYGGSVKDPNGTAGVSLGYGTSFSSSFDMAIMPDLYNQNGAAVNNSESNLPSGFYYIGGGSATGGNQVQYYGNGTFYNPATQQYGGSVSNPNGTSGVSLGYSM